MRLRERGGSMSEYRRKREGRPAELREGKLEGPSQHFFVLFHSFPRRRNGGQTVAAIKKSGRCKRDFHIQQEE